jgi:hypothetical protein
MRRRRALALAFLAVVAAPAAAAQVTPDSVRAQAQGLLGSVGASDLAVFPTRLPAHYAYDSYSVTGSPPSFNVTFADKRFEASSAQLGQHALSFDASYFRGKQCANGASETLRVGGIKLYADATLVWRCIATPHHVVVESAHGRAAKASLAIIVAYARPAA